MVMTENEGQEKAVAVDTLPNGCTLYMRPNGVGGRTYYTDEIGGGAIAWDTSIIDSSTLICALNYESGMTIRETVAARKLSGKLS
jgi:hypothetical protein